jgi:hypothetical protein
MDKINLLPKDEELKAQQNKLSFCEWFDPHNVEHML